MSGGLWSEDTYNSEPVWVGNIIRRLEAAGYIVECKYDADGQSWQNKLYTVWKMSGEGQKITYLQDQRAQALLRIAIG